MTTLLTPQRFSSVSVEYTIRIAIVTYDHRGIYILGSDFQFALHRNMTPSTGVILWITSWLTTIEEVITTIKADLLVDYVALGVC
jgi:hypothetical protein